MKYRNRKTEVDGILFDSRREAARYGQLQLLIKAGKISDLRLQVKFELAPAVVIKGRKRPSLKYIADFAYFEAGRLIVEDVKGVITEGYRIKRHLMKAVHNIDVQEVS